MTILAVVVMLVCVGCGVLLASRPRADVPVAIETTRVRRRRNR